MLSQGSQHKPETGFWLVNQSQMLSNGTKNNKSNDVTHLSFQRHKENRGCSIAIFFLGGGLDHVAAQFLFRSVSPAFFWNGFLAPVFWKNVVPGTFSGVVFLQMFFQEGFFSCMSACAVVALLCLWVVDVTLFVFAVAVSQTAPTTFGTFWL